MKNSDQPSIFKQKLLHWANQFDVCCFLDSNHYKDQYSAYDFIVATGVNAELKSNYGDAFEKLKTFQKENKQWLFGFFSYDLKNEIEDLHSDNLDKLNFPDLYFFIPAYLIAVKDGKIEVLVGDKDVLDEINDIDRAFLPAKNGAVLPASKIGKNDKRKAKSGLDIKPRLTKDQYLDKVEHLKKHIIRGDIYEINFCQEFFAENAFINPIETFEALNMLSPTPFGGYFKLNDQYILSATPERFLCKRGNKLISQPIKGTARRNIDPIQDHKIKYALKNDLKEQTENVMIVDLVRHDLTKSALKGSVKVDELFGVYSFPQVHQLISTISCDLNPEIHFIDAIKNTFPMGSMTGAPKIKAMELIEEFEVTKRGIYSGSFGCINPNGDFDFNVVIRSILYNKQNNYLSFQVGGAITYHSDAEKEYEECLLKASAILSVLESEI
ncbi:anthranilate synthase component I family protein [Pedobacter changchengzhani]|uniref:Anthranilate synthase component I family protein n=1 Tax=Pedobacter changchengzhani TaxID=2529274 RepID=A0A4R5MLK0_9SPHI|nr:anthranilate synthase component I family protein [Pedobacter changchengzhani]TDG36590.1 anthranilate synthase component I family protein [Pedobacter changchengzhani]